MTYEFHPIAELFPRLSEQESKELAESIKAIGQNHAITLYESKILDGRERYTACQAIGLEPKFEPLRDGVNPYEFVAAENLHRRHLTVGQRAAIAADMANLKHGSNRYEKKVELPKESSTNSNAGMKAKSGVTVQQAATIMKVSASKVYAVQKIKKEDPQKFAEIKAGKAKIGNPYKKAETNGDGAKAANWKDDPAYQKFEAEQLAKINAPSIYPHIPLPVNDNKHRELMIQTRIKDLKAVEAQIGQMSKADLSNKVHSHVQAIQTYGMPEDGRRVTGPIDPLWIDWAKSVALKYLLRHQLIDKQDYYKNRAKGGNGAVDYGKAKKKPEVDLFEQQWTAYAKDLKEALKRFHADDRKEVIARTVAFIEKHFAPKPA